MTIETITFGMILKVFGVIFACIFGVMLAIATFLLLGKLILDVLGIEE